MGLVWPGKAKPALSYCTSSKSLADNATFAHRPLSCHSERLWSLYLPSLPFSSPPSNMAAGRHILASLTQHRLPTALDDTRVLVLVP